MTFFDGLARFGAAVASEAPLGELRRLAAALLGAVPDGLDDVYAVTEGLVALLDNYDERVDPQLLASQLEGEIATLTFLAGEFGLAAEASPAVAAAPATPEWVDPAMLAEFVDAQRHALDDVEQIALEAASAGLPERQRLARLLHTMKGESATVGFDELEELYHAVEDRLDGARSLVEVADLLLAVKDWVLGAVTARVAGHPSPPGLKDLLRWARGSQVGATAAAGPAPVPHRSPPAAVRTTARPLPSDPEMVALFVEFYEEASESLVQADEVLVRLEADGPAPESVDALFRIFHTVKGLAGFLDLSAIGELAHASEALLDQARRDPKQLTAGRLDLLLESTQMTRALLEATREAVERGATQAPTVDGYERLLRDVEAGDRGGATAGAAANDVEEAADDEAAADGPAQGGDRALTVVRETIKVDLHRVDALVETIGELVIMEAMVSGSQDLRKVASQRTRHQIAQLAKIVRDLQRQGLALRMVPLHGVFQKMSRLVRDLSRRSGKRIRLELSGQDAEMDRSLAERLGDPLVHMIRNAVDHGVEMPDERVKVGKPELSTVKLSAYHEGGNIIIELTDDGRGLNRDAILRKARDRGLIAEHAVLAEAEVWDLIFHPGFSTAEKVTEISGRGVGMDVVKKTVESLRGRIQIATTAGQGTTFRFVLPLTLAIIDGMLMRCGGGRYVLPTLAILESMQPTLDQVHGFAAGGMLLDVRGQQLPLVDLAGLLGLPTRSREEIPNSLVVIMDGAQGKVGLLVDDDKTVLLFQPNLYV